VRSMFLSVAGKFGRKISNGIHILNGHVASFSPDKKRGVFDKQLKSLRNECEFIKIEKAVALIKGGAKVDQPLVAFTFDDGYLDCYTDIAPALDRFNTNAAFFINPNFMDGSAEYREALFRERVPDIPVRGVMDRQMVIELAESGFMIGAHTMDHLRLVGLPTSQVSEQIIGSKLAIEGLIKRPCEYFAWTYGKFSDIDSDSLSLALNSFDYVFSSDRYGEYMTSGVCNRRHFECDWPYSHVRYFLSKERTRV
jgi:peptidoglycan/xylan/chitin deacetylase (PgdA/CDA1 family)